MGLRMLAGVAVGLLAAGGAAAALANFVPWWLAVFLGLVSGVLGLFGGYVWQRHVEQRALALDWASVTTPVPGGNSPADTDQLLVSLNPDQQVVRFNQLRTGQVRTLHRWCTGILDDDHRTGPVWLVESEPGDGKTRLLIELAGQLTAEGWECGWAGPGQASEAVAVADRFESPVLLIVDDADTHPDLSAALICRCSAAAVPPGGPELYQVVRHDRTDSDSGTAVQSGTDRAAASQLAAQPQR
jgi:hypothetical protein